MLRRLALVALVAIAFVGYANAQDPIVYQNTGGPYYYWSDGGTGNWPTIVTIDDGHFTTGTDVYKLTELRYAVAVPDQDPGNTDPTLPVDFRMVINMYNGLPSGSDYSTAVTPANWLGGFSQDWIGTDSKGTKLYAATVALPTPIYVPGQNFIVEFACIDPVTGELSNLASPVLSVGGPTVGTSDDLLFIDDDLNGVYEMPDEAYVWQPDPSNPNYQFSYYLRLRGTKTAIPEPGTLALLGLGVLPLIRRRKA